VADGNYALLLSHAGRIAESLEQIVDLQRAKVGVPARLERAPRLRPAPVFLAALDQVAREDEDEDDDMESSFDDEEPVAEDE
jgi:hypothetical protein